MKRCRVENCSRPSKTAQRRARSNTRTRLAAGRLRASRDRRKCGICTLRLMTQRQQKRPWGFRWREHGCRGRGGPRSRHSSCVGRKMTIEILIQRVSQHYDDAVDRVLYSLLSSVMHRHATIYDMSVLLCLDTSEVCEGRVAFRLWKLKLRSTLAFACSPRL